MSEPPIEESIEWLRGELGVAPLNVPVILPTSEYFPPPGRISADRQDH